MGGGGEGRGGEKIHRPSGRGPNGPGANESSELSTTSAFVHLQTTRALVISAQFWPADNMRTQNEYI